MTMAAEDAWAKAIEAALHAVMRGESWAAISDARAALSAAGWAVVPREPTEAMALALMTPVAAALEGNARPVVEVGREAYRAMLAAATADIPASGQVEVFAGLPIKVDPNLPPRTAEFRDPTTGAVLGRIVDTSDIPASGPQRAGLRVKPDFGR